jgi:hypothetical protein
MNGPELIRTLAQRDGLKPPPVKVARGPLMMGRVRLRGAYNAITHEITLADPNDLENAQHEYCHYQDHMRYGNPVATVICQDRACNYHTTTC